MFNISVICCHSAGWYDLCVNVHSDKGLQLVGEHGAWGDSWHQGSRIDSLKALVTGHNK